jgi:SAM-dependent methyltransferase
MKSTSREFFEDMYRTTPDPWSFASSQYEQERYATTLEFVPPGRFSNVFEPGCSIGDLTAQLAERCGFVTAIDIAEAAVETARRRCEAFDNVDIHQGSLVDDVPAGPFDLVVLSEVAYYFASSRLVDLGAELASRIEPGGQLLAVHWIGESADHVLGGEVVHDLLLEHLPMDHVHHDLHRSQERDGFVLDLWRQPASPDSRRT